MRYFLYLRDQNLEFRYKHRFFSRTFTLHYLIVARYVFFWKLTMTKTHNISSVMRGAMCLAFFVVSILQLNAQINTQQVMNIGRNALYFEDYLLSLQ